MGLLTQWELTLQATLAGRKTTSFSVFILDSDCFRSCFNAPVLAIVRLGFGPFHSGFACYRTCGHLLGVVPRTHTSECTLHCAPATGSMALGYWMSTVRLGSGYFCAELQCGLVC